MGNVISLESRRMNKQYEQYYQRCSNFDLSLDEVHPTEIHTNDIKLQMIRGYMKLLNPTKYKGGE